MIRRKAFAKNEFCKRFFEHAVPKLLFLFPKLRSFRFCVD